MLNKLRWRRELETCEFQVAHKRGLGGVHGFARPGHTVRDRVEAHGRRVLVKLRLVRLVGRAVSVCSYEYGQAQAGSGGVSAAEKQSKQVSRGGGKQAQSSTGMGVVLRRQASRRVLVGLSGIELSGVTGLTGNWGQLRDTFGKRAPLTVRHPCRKGPSGSCRPIWVMSSYTMSSAFVCALGRGRVAVSKVPQ